MQNTTHNVESATPKKSGFWIFVLGLILISLFWGVTLFLRGGAPATTDPEEAARDAERVKNLADVKAEEEKKLNSYAWVDKAKGNVQIPIADAMKLVLAELNEKKPSPAYPILNAAGQPISTSVEAPAQADQPDNLPTQPVASEQAAQPVLNAPVDNTADKPAKSKKTSNQ